MQLFYNSTMRFKKQINKSQWSSVRARMRQINLTIVVDRICSTVCDRRILFDSIDAIEFVRSGRSFAFYSIERSSRTKSDRSPMVESHSNRSTEDAFDRIRSMSIDRATRSPAFDSTRFDSIAFDSIRLRPLRCRRPSPAFECRRLRFECDCDSIACVIESIRYS